MLSVYHLVATLVIEMEFNRRHTDKRKCVDLSLVTIVMKTMINYQTRDLQSIYQFFNLNIEKSV